MDIFIHNVLPAICLALAGVCTLIWLPIMGWQVIMGIRGFLPLRKIVGKEGKENSFAIMICARNEEEVICNLIDSIQKQNYPKDKYKIFCVADNCTDNTAGVARDMGCEVLERFDKERQGKGFPLEMVTEYVNTRYAEQFDAYMVVDADNLLPNDFLAKLNGGLNAGYDVVSGWRMAKNPHDSWVSGCYDIFWSIVMRLHDSVRCNFGLSCNVHGTGFAVRRELVKDGWQTSTITEDCEFSCMARMKGARIGIIRDARFYDEQPTKLRFFFSQFHRWEVGGVQCGLKLWRQAAKLMKHRFLEGFDMLCFLLLPVAQTAMFAAMIPYSLWLALVGAPLRILLLAALMVVGSTLAVIALAAIALIYDGKPAVRMWRSVLMFPIFILPTSVIAVASIVRPKAQWKTIPHNSAKDVENVDEIPPDPLVEKVKNLRNK